MINIGFFLGVVNFSVYLKGRVFVIKIPGDTCSFLLD